MPDHTWMRDGSCIDGDPDLWINESRLAIEICVDCPVRTQCYKYGMERHPIQGVYGGFTLNQRSRLRRKQRPY